MELQFKERSLNSCRNLKIRGLGATFCVAFYYFNFERNYDILKSESIGFVEQKYKL